MSLSPWRDEMDELLQDDKDTLCLQPSDVDMLLEETLDETQTTTTPPTIERVGSKVENWATYKQKKAEGQKAKEEGVQKAKEQKAKEEQVQKAKEKEERSKQISEAKATQAKKATEVTATRTIPVPSNSGAEETSNRVKQYSKDGKRYAVKQRIAPSSSSSLSSQKLNQPNKQQFAGEFNSDLPELGQPV